jgi:hypothetical protein
MAGREPRHQLAIGTNRNFACDRRVVEELPEFWDHVDEEARSICRAFAIVPAAEQKTSASVTKDELRWY